MDEASIPNQMSVRTSRYGNAVEETAWPTMGRQSMGYQMSQSQKLRKETEPFMVQYTGVPAKSS